MITIHLNAQNIEQNIHKISILHLACFVCAKLDHFGMLSCSQQIQSRDAIHSRCVSIAKPIGWKMKLAIHRQINHPTKY